MFTLLRRKTRSLQDSCSNTIVFSGTHRYDLPSWSIVNKEVEKATEKIRKVSKIFQNVKFVDVSRLGQKLYRPTIHGLQ